MERELQKDFDLENWRYWLCDFLKLLQREDLINEILLLDVEEGFAAVEKLRIEFQRALVNRHQHKGVDSSKLLQLIGNGLNRLEKMRNEIISMRHQAFLKEPKNDPDN